MTVLRLNVEGSLKMGLAELLAQRHRYDPRSSYRSRIRREIRQTIGWLRRYRKTGVWAP